MAIRKVALVTGSGKRRISWHVAELSCHSRLPDRPALSRIRQEGLEAAAALQAMGVDAAAFQADSATNAKCTRWFRRYWSFSGSTSW